MQMGFWRKGPGGGIRHDRAVRAGGSRSGQAGIESSEESGRAGLGQGKQG